MHQARPVGRAAASRKYDLLTALGAFALSQERSAQTRVLRLMTLVTARYNWARDELAVGQREIAALWSVDERTVKREMARLRAMGWLIVRRQGARGRVTEYRMDIDRMLGDTRPAWDRVGPDFALRMQGPEAGQGAEILPMPVRGEVPPPDLSPGTEWALAQALLHQENPGQFAAWIRGLDRAGRMGGRLTLAAPSRFHAAYVQTHLEPRILAALRSVDEDVTELRIVTRA